MVAAGRDWDRVSKSQVLVTRVSWQRLKQQHLQRQMRAQRERRNAFGSPVASQARGSQHLLSKDNALIRVSRRSAYAFGLACETRASRDESAIFTRALVRMMPLVRYTIG